ncbi:MAG: lysozyme [Pseudomonadota bacterium]
MKTSPRGAFAIAAHEGIVPAAYLDSVGVRTFGIGHTASAGYPDPATISMEMPEDLGPNMALAIQTFLADLAIFERRVLAATEGVELEQHQFDALVSFDFNTGGIHRARLTQRINAGNFAPDLIKTGFMGWTKAGGKVREYLKRRRTEEAAMFNLGEYPAAASVPVWSVTPSGRPDFSFPGLIDRIGYERFAALLAQKQGQDAQEADPAPEPAKTKEPPTGHVAAPAVGAGLAAVAASYNLDSPIVLLGCLVVLLVSAFVAWRVMRKRKKDSS